MGVRGAIWREGVTPSRAASGDDAGVASVPPTPPPPPPLRALRDAALLRRSSIRSAWEATS